jgi:hypothetical protein
MCEFQGKNCGDFRSFTSSGKNRRLRFLQKWFSRRKQKLFERRGDLAQISLVKWRTFRL